MSKIAGDKTSDPGHRRKPKTIRFHLACLAALFAVLVIVTAGMGALYQAIATARDLRKYPPPGKMVDIGGYRLHLYSTGEGNPTVLMDAGLGNTALSWSWVQPELSKFTRVCTYDRAGLGWSDPSPFPRTSGQIVKELRAALAKAGVHGPYILVGHSFGGFNVRLFAYQYPDEVTGMVLVDSSHEDQLINFPSAAIRLREERLENYNWRGQFSFFGLTRLQTGPNTSLPPEWQDASQALKSRTPTYRTVCAEMQGFEQSAAQVRKARRPLKIPSVVLTAGDDFQHPELTEQDCAYYNKAWKEMQADLASQLNGSHHIVVPESGHSIQLDQPDAVVAAVIEVLKKVRAQSPDTSTRQPAGAASGSEARFQ
jgi:pimeloyl-ACP methyl ester carboxylesterase